MAISKRFNCIGFFLILLTCSIKCQNYNVKTAVFVSNSLANRFYDLYDVRTHPSKEDFIKSFVLSIYSFEVSHLKFYFIHCIFFSYSLLYKKIQINEFFKTLTGPALNLRSNMIYFRILSIADESNIRDSSEFCAYQDNLKQSNPTKWNVAIYLIEYKKFLNFYFHFNIVYNFFSSSQNRMFQPFTDFHSSEICFDSWSFFFILKIILANFHKKVKSICDSACLVSKTSPLLSEMLFQSSNQVSPVKQVIFEMLQHFYFEKK